MVATKLFIKQMVDAIASAGKEMKKAKGKAPPKGQYRPTPSGDKTLNNKATSAATSKKEIAGIKATNKRNKDMYGIGDDTPKYKQRAKRTAQLGVTGVAAASSFSALPSKAELSKSIKSYLEDKEAPTAAQAKTAARKALKDSDLDASQVKAIMNKVDMPKAESKKTGTDSMSFGEAFKAARKAGKKQFTWRGKKYHTKTKDEQIAAEKFSAGGYKKPKKAAGGMLNSKRPRTGTMDYRKGGLFK